MRTNRLVVPALFATLIPCHTAFAASSDYDGDGRSDVLWRNADDGSDVIWRSANAGTRLRIAAIKDMRWKVVGEGDFDGDGRADVFWRNAVTGANTIWRSGDARTVLSVAPLGNLQWIVAGIGDFDGDGRSDAFWRNLRTGANMIWPSGRASGARVMASVTDLHWLVAGIGDFDGDHRSDVLWRNASTGANVIWKSAFADSRQAVRKSERTWVVAAIGDFDGDGQSDVFWRDTAGGFNALWRSARATTTVDVPSVSRPWEVAASGDFDGDGRADLLWRNFETGTNAGWNSADSATKRYIARLPELGWLPVPFEAEPYLPLASIDQGEMRIAEGNSGFRPASFALRLSHPSVVPVSYPIHVNEGGLTRTPPATAGTDYAAPPTSGVIAPGETLGLITVRVRGDTRAEPNEAFSMNVYPVEGAVMWWVDASDTTILNDDANTLWIEGASVREGDSGAKPMDFAIHLSRPSTVDVTYDIETRDIPSGLFVATAGSDYIARRRTGVVLPAGATSSKFRVWILGDVVWEPLGESFGVIVSHVSGATLVIKQAGGDIFDDEEPIIP